ncbi:unnamed protein product, partial [Coffea canephora]
IIGSIPREIWNLTRLQRLYLGHNYLENNQIEGSIPRDIGNLTALKELYLGVNNLTVDCCIVPDSISNSSKLTHVEFARNRLTRPIYIVFGNLQSLECLVLFDNNLTNESSLVELSFVTALTECRYLRVISVANNRLTGVLPVSIGKLSSSIEEIYAGGCKMKGRIPKTVGNLSNLRVLDLLGFILSSNFLTGSLPSEIGLLKVATWINLSMNQFSNNIPSRIGDLANLNHLSLAYNNFEGTIPESISNMLSLESSQTPSIHKSRTKKVLQTKLLVFGVSAIIAGVALAFLFFRYVQKEKVPNGTNLFSLTAKGRISYCELLQATNGYDESNLLSFGSVYKGILANGICVAIKVFNLQLEYTFKRPENVKSYAVLGTEI